MHSSVNVQDKRTDRAEQSGRWLEGVKLVVWWSKSSRIAIKLANHIYRSCLSLCVCFVRMIWTEKPIEKRPRSAHLIKCNTKDTDRNVNVRIDRMAANDHEWIVCEKRVKNKLTLATEQAKWVEQKCKNKKRCCRQRKVCPPKRRSPTALCNRNCHRIGKQMKVN